MSTSAASKQTTASAFMPPTISATSSPLMVVQRSAPLSTKTANESPLIYRHHPSPAMVYQCPQWSGDSILAVNPPPIRQKKPLPMGRSHTIPSSSISSSPSSSTSTPSSSSPLFSSSSHPSVSVHSSSSSSGTSRPHFNPADHFAKQSMRSSKMAGKGKTRERFRRDNQPQGDLLLADHSNVEVEIIERSLKEVIIGESGPSRGDIRPTGTK